MYKFAPLCLALVAGATAGISIIPLLPTATATARPWANAPFQQGGQGSQRQDDYGREGSHGGDDRNRHEQAPSTVRYLATFDDLDPDQTGLGRNGDIGPYDGLYYYNWDVASSANGDDDNTLVIDTRGDMAAVTPESPDNVAQSIDPQDNAMTTQYPGSVTNVLDMRSMYLACGENGLVGVLTAAADCVLQVVAYRNTLEVGRREVTYVAGGGSGSGSGRGRGGSFLSRLFGRDAGQDSNMLRVEFDRSFEHVDTVKIFSRASDGVLIYVDDVRYRVYDAGDN